MNSGFSEDEYILYRLEKAWKTIHDAEILAYEGVGIQQ